MFTHPPVEPKCVSFSFFDTLFQEGLFQTSRYLIAIGRNLIRTNTFHNRIWRGGPGLRPSLRLGPPGYAWAEASWAVFALIDSACSFSNCGLVWYVIFDSMRFLVGHFYSIYLLRLNDFSVGFSHISMTQLVLQVGKSSQTSTSVRWKEGVVPRPM